MSTQLLVVPSSTKNLVDENGLASRNLQLWFSGVTNNINQNGVDIGILQANIVFPPGGIILWPPAPAPLPAGWVDTLETVVSVPGGIAYRLLSHP